MTDDEMERAANLEVVVRSRNATVMALDSDLREARQERDEARAEIKRLEDQARGLKRELAQRKQEREYLHRGLVEARAFALAYARERDEALKLAEEFKGAALDYRHDAKECMSDYLWTKHHGCDHDLYPHLIEPPAEE